MQSLRSGMSREDSPSNLRRLKDHVPSAMSSRANLGQRASSPTSSPNGGLHRDTSVNHKSPGGKRSLLDKLKLHRHKEDRDPPESLKTLPSSVRSLQELPRKIAKLEPSPNVSKRDRDGSAATFDSGATARPLDYAGSEKTIPKQEKAVRPHLGHHGRMRTARRGLSYTGGSKDLQEGRADAAQNQSLFSLDTDLSRMEGIVSQPPIDPPDGGIFTGLPTGDEEPRKDLDEINGGAGGWNAPDSWAVKKVGDENMGRLREIDDTGVPPKDEDDGTPHCVRVFRVDSTFATLSTTVNTTVSEILQLLGRKSFLQDDLENYQLLMRKHDLQRHLQAGERPIAIQKRLLEQAGYTESDRLDEIGREDNSYLCRFTFVPTKLSGYYSLVSRAP